MKFAPAQAPTVIACCDWSLAEEKRWMAVAERENGKYYMFPPEPVGQPETLFAELRDRARGGGVFVGFNFPIGLPRRFAELTGITSFLEALPLLSAGLPATSPTSDETAKAELAQLAGADRSYLLRRCDRVLRSGELFPLGTEQTGIAAVAGWRDVLAPSLTSISLWPFHERSLERMLALNTTTVAEIYPAAVYSLAGVHFTRSADKASHTARRDNAPNMLDWFEHRPIRSGGTLAAMIEDGFGETSGEDMFDAVLGLMGMFDVVTGVLTPGAPHDDEAVYQVEGWIAGLQHEDVL